MKNKKAKEPMKNRAIRFTDSQWSDALLVGMPEIRKFVTKRAAKLKKEK